MSWKYIYVAAGLMRVWSPKSRWTLRPILFASLLVGLVASVLMFWGLRPGLKSSASSFVQVVERIYSDYAGSRSCEECHRVEYQGWRISNHHLAERSIDPSIDREAFDPARVVRHGSQESEVRLVFGRFEIVTKGFGARTEAYPVERVIGREPLRQYLVARPGGRYQVTELAWDPIQREWFDVYGEEDRQPGEWGHWTGRGMNWNSMCAFCHNTRFFKNYIEKTDSYQSLRFEMGVGCEACHGPMKAHVVWQRAHPDAPRGSDPTLRPLSTNQWLWVCGSCHSRRGELTGDFVPGSDFFDHFTLVTVDLSETYYADGQVRDEDYEFAAFLGSRMGGAGLSCLDCHDPHRAVPLYNGNELCMRCHNGSYPNAPAIEPSAHSSHKPQSKGDACRDCHMPVTIYMARDPRHDHGFTVPDPWITKELGIPNACNRCHEAGGVDWAIEWCEKWYGLKMQSEKRRLVRERTRTISLARRADPEAATRLASILATEQNPYWRASLISVLANWIDQNWVQEAIGKYLDDLHPLVREKALHALAPAAGLLGESLRQKIEERLTDPVRCVRLAAAWAVQEQVDLKHPVMQELAQMLDLNCDQPIGRLQRAVFLYRRGELKKAIADLETAVQWDPYSAPLRHELAVLYSAAGRSQDALIQMQEACRLDPKDIEYQYRLALVYGEVGDITHAVELLEKVVNQEPNHLKAWYNLGVGLLQLGRFDEAIIALERAESLNQKDPRIPFARATALVRLGRFDEAIAAASRALELDAQFEAARQLLDEIRRMSRAIK